MDNDALFYTCSLVEYIARKTNNKRKDVIIYLDMDVNRIYKYADVFHCEPIEKVANDFIRRQKIPEGNYIHKKESEYKNMDYWDVGKLMANKLKYNKLNNIYELLLKIEK